MKTTFFRLLGFAGFALLSFQVLLLLAWALGQTGRPSLAHTLFTPHVQHSHLVPRGLEWAQFLAQNNPPNQLIFGSSAAMFGIVPTQLDSLTGNPAGTTFSWASHGQSLREIPALLKAASEEVEPDRVIICLSPVAWDYAPNAPPETALNWITQHPNWTAPWRRAMWRLAWESRSVHACLLWMHKAVFQSITGPVAVPSTSPNGRYAGQGHVENLRQPMASTVAKTSTRQFPTAWVPAVDEISRHCEERGIDLVYLVMPSFPNLQWEMPPILNGKQVIRGDGWPGKRNSKHYSDPIHLRSEGSRAFVNWLATSYPNPFRLQPQNLK
jgi:hypothetical protein